MPAAVLRIHITQLSEPETALWCESCALPSGVGTWIGWSTDSRVLSLTWVAGCADCGRALP